MPTISHVINFGLPMKAEDYVHRIGRTGRAGRSGIAVTLAEHRERVKIRAIERYTQQPLAATVIAGLEPQRVERPRRPDDGRPGFRSGAPRPAGARPAGARGHGGPARGTGGPRSGPARPAGGGGDFRGARRSGER